MKIVHFSSGLGNQIFFYLFYRYLQTKYPDDSVYGYYISKNLRKHNGLELDKVFNVELPPSTLCSNMVAWLCRKLNGLGFPGLKATDKKYSENAIYFDGWYQDKKYFLDNLNELRFKEFKLNRENTRILQEIKSSQSVFIHIRRGDYLAPEHIAEYGGICTDQYYKKAIAIIQKRFDNPKFFVFSNDLQWVIENMDMPNCVYVDGNFGTTSYLDMYLMSYCNAAIIANSSFSYWGAMLNRRKIVVYPRKWFNSHTPDMFPESWIPLF